MALKIGDLFWSHLLFLTVRLYIDRKDFPYVADSTILAQIIGKSL